MSTTTLNPVLQVRRVFDATPEELFDAWFTREQWQAWIGPEGCQCDVPLLEAWKGGRYRIQMHLHDGREIPVEGEFQVVDRPLEPHGSVVDVEGDDAHASANHADLAAKCR